MFMPKDSIIEEIVASIRQLYRAVYQDSSNMSRRFGLTPSQSGVLRILVKNGPQSSAELSRALFVTPSNITGIIDRLEKKALVVRNPKKGDRRVCLITLTAEGTQISLELPDPIEEKLIGGLAEMLPEEVQNLNASLKQIVGLIDVAQMAEHSLDLPQEECKSASGNR